VRGRTIAPMTGTAVDRSLLERIRRRILFSRAFRKVVRWGRRIVLPGFEGFNVYEIARLYFRALLDGMLMTRAAAISFKLFVAIFPATIVMLTLIPFVPVPTAQDALLRSFHDLLPPEVYRFVESELQNLIVRPHGTLLSFSFLGGVYFASNGVDAILSGFKGSSNVTSWHSPCKQRLLSVVLLFVLTALLVVAIPVMTVSGGAIRMLKEQSFLTSTLQVAAMNVVRWTLAGALLMASVSLLYQAGDPRPAGARRRRRIRLVTPGTVVAVVMIIALSQLLALFFRHFTDYNALYGSIGAILAVQLWLYANMTVVLIGHELNVSISRARHDRSQRLRLSDAGGSPDQGR
jgi:membrane protein